MVTNTFTTTKKSSLANSDGVKYTDFKASLKPNYLIVWLQIILGYLVVAVSLFLVAYTQQHYLRLFWLSIPLGALSIGYWFAFTHLFIHEASHYNIAADKRINDVLANIFLGLIAGTHIKFYRIIHFDHHRYLGMPNDTENTYFEALNWKFIIASFTGIRVIKVLTARNKTVRTNESLNAEILRKNRQMSVAGALFNLSLVMALYVAGYWYAALAWLAGIGVIFPFFLSLRQLLEHRGDKARAAIDYSKTEHGATSRMFGAGIIASTLGSAGFNRHLLHHWDPHVPCTRLKDLEHFLNDTDLAADMQRTHTNYFKTFLTLFNK